MASGQPVLDATTRGGWFKAADNLRQTLITLGLPARQPLTTPSPATPAASAATPASPQAASAPAPALWPRVALGLALVLAVAAAGVLFLRRRSNPAGTATAP
jgi:hypothetical protein